MPQWVSALIIGVIALIAALASNKVLETIMQVFVSVMGVLFLVTAIAVAPNLGQVVTGLVPVVPEGGLMNTMALIGTTLIGMNLILHSITSQGKYTSIEELPMPVLTFVSTSLSVLSSLLLSLSLVALCCMGPALPSMAP